MTFMTLLEEAQLHREVYIAVLDGLLRERGDKRALAEQAGVSPQYLSYLLAARPGVTRRDPSPAAARRLAEALPIAAADRDLLLGHMLLSNRKRLDAHRAAQRELPAAPSACWFEDLRRAYHDANFGQDPALARRRSLEFSAQSGLALAHLAPGADPVRYARLALLAHEVEWMLHRPTEALWRVKQARHALEAHVSRRYFDHAVGPSDALVETIRNEAVSYHNLGLFAQAYRRCEQAGALLAQGGPKDRAHWEVHLYRDQLNALIGLARYTLSEAEYLASRVEHGCEHGDYSDRECELLTALIHSGLARAYVRYGGAANLAKAEKLVRQEYERLDRLSYFGPLHRVQVLRAYADLCATQRNRSGWAYFIGLALQTAYAAGLLHQISDIERACGSPGA